LTNIEVVLTHLIHTGWVKNLSTNVLAFNIAQFFSSLNHQLLPLTLTKTGFDSKISLFFCNYLVSKKTKYFWNSFLSPSFNVNVGIE